MVDMVDIDFFRNRLELITESPSQIVFKCPVCEGKLKMNKTTKAYCCFSSWCSPSDIRNKLGLFSGKRVTQIEPKLITPVYVQKDNLELQKVALTQPFHKKFFYEKFNTKAVVTSYYYDDTHRVDRVKLLNNGDKVFYPKVFKNGKWQISSEGFSFYNVDKVQENKTLLFAEGEKCAAEVSRFFLCLTAPGFGSNSHNFLSSNLRKIAHLVKNVVVFSDPDEIGQKKALLLQRVCWSLYLPCSVIKPSLDGDIYDVIHGFCDTDRDNVKELIKSFL